MSPNHAHMNDERPASFTIADIPAGLDDGDWFHGSQEMLSDLAIGSSITRSRAVAEAFSHRPTCLGIDMPDGGCPISVCHNGSQPGILYTIDEPISDVDVYPHPKSSAPGLGFEWLTTRPLRLRKIADLPVTEPPCPPDCPRRPRPE